VFELHGVKSFAEICDDINLMSNSSSSWFLISSNHNNLDASFFALINGIGNFKPRRVVERDQTDESQTVHGEEARNRSIVVHQVFNGVGFEVVHFELILIIIPLGFEVADSESKNSFSFVSHFSILFV
jgi:hypothetical protein